MAAARLTGAFRAAPRVQVTQHFATSADGTKVPYFLVSRVDMPLDGTTPTLLYGYGGFEISLTPAYIASVGAGWLEAGGAYAQANIRGGGEYGPRWHQAALKEKRARAYEDFEAVAMDLVARGVTSAAKLGVQGGSNGGLLTGNMLARSPHLFGAILVQARVLGAPPRRDSSSPHNRHATRHATATRRRRAGAPPRHAAVPHSPRGRVVDGRVRQP